MFLIALSVHINYTIQRSNTEHLPVIVSVRAGHLGCDEGKVKSTKFLDSSKVIKCLNGSSQEVPGFLDPTMLYTIVEAVLKIATFIEFALLLTHENIQTSQMNLMGQNKT